MVSLSRWTQGETLGASHETAEVKARSRQSRVRPRTPRALLINGALLRVGRSVIGLSDMTVSLLFVRQTPKPTMGSSEIRAPTRLTHQWTKVVHDQATNGAIKSMRIRNASREWPSQPIPRSKEPTARTAKRLEYRFSRQPDGEETSE